MTCSTPSAHFYKQVPQNATGVKPELVEIQSDPKELAEKDLRSNKLSNLGQSACKDEVEQDPLHNP